VIITYTLNKFLAFSGAVAKERKDSQRLVLGDPARMSEAYIIAAIKNPNGFRKPSFKDGFTRKSKRMGRGVVGGNVVKRDFQPSWTGSARGNKRRAAAEGMNKWTG
jgi:hypothetical protein